MILPSSPSDFTHISPSSLPAFMVSSSTSPSLYDEDDQPTLRGTYDACKGAIHNDSVIILDGLSELLYMGFSLTSVWRFVRAIHMLSLRVSSSSLGPSQAHVIVLCSSCQRPAYFGARIQIISRARPVGEDSTYRYMLVEDRRFVEW